MSRIGIGTAQNFFLPGRSYEDPIWILLWLPSMYFFVCHHAERIKYRHQWKHPDHRQEEQKFRSFRTGSCNDLSKTSKIENTENRLIFIICFCRTRKKYILNVFQQLPVNIADYGSMEYLNKMLVKILWTKLWKVTVLYTNRKIELNGEASLFNIFPICF